MDRYVILDTRGSLVAGVFHNAPTQMQAYVGGLESLAHDPIADRASSSRIPFVWSAADAGEWRTTHGDFGYRSGVAASSWGPTGAGCVVLISCAEQQIPEASAHAFTSYALMAAVMASGPLKEINARTQAPCPFTPRELDCLLYELAGMTAKQAARALGISPRSVRQYLERARARLGVKSSYAAATTAARYGWVDIKRAGELAESGSAAGARQVGRL